MRDEFRPAIDALQQDLADLERKVAETKATINRLCELAGAPPLYADVGTPGSQPSIASIRADSFYGKVIVTAAREYLEMRKAAGLGPASPRDIYEALRKGGFAFDTKIENNAITGIRNTLRKASSIFHRLPHGEYGLLKWYPRAKAPKEEAEVEPEKPRKRGRPRKHAHTKTAADKKPAAAAELRKARAPHEGTRGSEKPPERKEEHHVAHGPDLSGPVAGEKAIA